MIFWRLLGGALLACTAFPSSFATAQQYPAKPIRIVVPFAAGGTADVLARVISQRLGPQYGQQILVDNRPGSGGHVGAETVAKSPADGYTLVLGTIGIHAAYGIYSRLPYDPPKELQPVILFAELPCVLIVHPSLPTKSVHDFLALARARPGAINFGSAGNGSSTHMTGELFKVMSRTNLTHVPYRGSAPALQDLIGGHIQAMFENLPTTLGPIAAKRVRALGVTGKERSPNLPDVPTVAEAGVPGYESTAWFTVGAPSKVAAAIVQKLNADLNALLGAPDMQQRWKDLGITKVGGTTDFAAKYFARETEKWNNVIKLAGIRGD
ncbi:MAG: tripartite tricarboxylate transporter substrate binding protein [Burkholderiales bacterium]|nr:tripartite tricarboxylate transporter substrate binding protein [Burkholderiales bacterium]